MMSRSSGKRRAGGIVLLLLWAQVATLNVGPCQLSCWLMAQREAARHSHVSMIMGHPAGHHIPGPQIASPESCDGIKLLAVSVVGVVLPAPVIGTVAVSRVVVPAPNGLVSAVPAFDTPPPKA